MSTSDSFIIIIKYVLCKRYEILLDLCYLLVVSYLRVQWASYLHRLHHWFP